MQNEIDRVKKLYEAEYQVEWNNWGYMWHPRNPISLAHAQILQWALVESFNQLNIQLVGKDVLDVGCGYGRILRFLIELGVSPQRAHGLELTPYRLKFCREISPIMPFTQASAAELPYADQSFDMISQFTVFSSIHDAGMRQKAALEIQRILRPGGWFIWYDIAKSKGGNVIPLPDAEVQQLFPGLRLKLKRPIFNTQIYRLIRRSVAVTWLWERLPFSNKSGLLMAFQKQN